MENINDAGAAVNPGPTLCPTPHDDNCASGTSREKAPSAKTLGTGRLSREQGRELAASHLQNAIRDIDGQSCETVARAVGFSQRNIVSRQCRGQKPVQLGDVYAMPRSVALRLLRSVLYDLESSPPDAGKAETVALRACGAAAGLAARIAEMLSDNRIDAAEGVELRAKARALVNELLTLSKKVG